MSLKVVTEGTSYTDPAGDSQTAPDITAVTAANDTAGNMTFTVRTNQPALAGDAVIAIQIDTDKNSSTGGAGIEFMFLMGSAGWQYLRYDGTNFVLANASSANGSYANGLATFKVSKADLGNVSTFNFYADSLQVDANASILASDTAPDGSAVYTYTPAPPPPSPKPLTLRAAAATYTPAKAAAGKTFAVNVRITRGDTGAALATGKVACQMTVGGKAVRATGSIRAGVATCTLKLPAGAKKKQLRGTMTVTFNGASVSKAFSRLL